MPRLSRRQFITAVSALAAATALPRDALAQALAQDVAPAVEAPSTLGRTILLGPKVSGQYRTLVAGAGEPYLPRFDVLGRAASADRAASRRSLLRAAHDHFGRLDVVVNLLPAPGRRLAAVLADADHPLTDQPTRTGDTTTAPEGA